VPRSGFETVVQLAGRPGYLQVDALDARGRKIGATLPRRLADTR